MEGRDVKEAGEAWEDDMDEGSGAEKYRQVQRRTVDLRRRNLIDIP